MAQAVLQSKSTKGVAVTSVAVTLTNVAGSMNAVQVAGWARAAAAGKVTDSRSQSYSFDATADGTNIHAALYSALNVAAGSTTITYHPTGAANDTDIGVMEVSNTATSSALDQTASSVSNAGTTTNTTGTTPTTTQANEIAIGVVSNEGQSGTWSGLTAGYTKAQEIDTTANVPIYTAYQVLSSTGTASFTVSGSLQPAVGCIATYKDNSGGAAAPTPQMTMLGIGP